MPLDRRLLAELRTLDLHDLRRVLIFVRGLLGAAGDELADSAPPVHAAEPQVTYRQEEVRCGKSGCTRCPHGPYWYAYYRDGKRLRSRYIGRELPADVRALMRGEGQGG